MKPRRRVLEAQAMSIEGVLAQHNVRGMVLRGTVTPHTIRYEVRTEAGTQVNHVTGLADEIALALGQRDVRVTREGDMIQVEAPRTGIDPVRLLPLCNRLRHVPPVTAVLGIDGDGAPLLLRLPAPDVAHVLIAGVTGAGKTALARTMLTSLIMHNRQSQVQLILIDPKARGFAPMQHMPHVLGDLVRDADEAQECLAWLVDEIERRLRARSAAPVIVLAIDELADLLQTGGREIEKLLARICQQGREAGVHVVACTQKPTAELIGSEIKASFPVRLVGAVASSEEARYATGINNSGAELLGGRGDFLLVTKGEIVRFQAAWVGRHDLEAVGMRLAQGGALPLRFAEDAPEMPAHPPFPTERKHRSLLSGRFGHLLQRIIGTA